jgi:hypothetical protein
MTDLEHYAGLQRLYTISRPVLASPDLAEVAEGFAARYERAYRFLSETLGVAPDVGLVVLSEADWPRDALIPTYGVTFYAYPHRMVVTAADSGTFWRPAIDLVRAHAPHLLQELQAVYGQPDGSIDLAAHIALWIAHDLGHAFHLDAEYWFPRRWLMEYCADLCCYTYVAAVEPAQLPALEVFPRALRAIDARHVRYHTLHDFEAQYDGGDWSNENYCWYHGFLFETAKQAYRAADVQALQRLWQAFVLANVREIADEQLAELLQHAQPELAQMMRTWPE